MDEIDKLGYGDNTLIFLYLGRQRFFAGEGQNGTISELLAQNGIPSTIKQHIEALEELGGLDALGSHKTDNMHHAGWALAAGSTPAMGRSCWLHILAARVTRWPFGGPPKSSPMRPRGHSFTTATTSYRLYTRYSASPRRIR